jgi:hypothetical protein
MPMSFRTVYLALIACFAISLSAQQPTAANQTPPVNPLQATISDAFGEGFTVDQKFAPLTGDFDADGTEDLAVVAFAKHAMANSNQKNYKVSDPYDAYFGFGDPKVTTAFSDFGDGSSHCVVIIHDWHSNVPKGKFVIVNLPFEELATANVPYKKKTLVGLAATEYGGLSATVFWDGKKYKWEPSEFTTSTKELDKASK